MKALFISCLCFFLTMLFSSCENHHQVDFHLQAKTKNDSLEFAEDFRYIQTFLENQQSDSISELNNILLQKAWNSDNKFYLGKSFFIKGYLDLSENERDSAYYFFNQAKEYFTEIRDSLETAKCLGNMAIIQSGRGDFYGAELNATEALKNLNNRQAEKPLYAAIYNCLAISSKNLQNYNEAVYWYRKAISVAEDQYSEATIRNNMAMAYVQSKNYQKADSIFNLLKKDSVIESDLRLKSKIIDNHAYVKWLAKLSGSHSEEMETALNMRNSIGYDWGLIASHSHLSDFYAETDPAKAKYHAGEMFRIAQKLNSPDDKLAALKKLISLENGEKVKKLSVRYSTLYDSIIFARNQTKDQFAKIRFDTKRNRQENELLRAETAEQQLEIERRKVYGIILVSLLALFAGGAYSFVRIQKIKSQKRLNEEIHATETKIAGKIHDELANKIYRIMSGVENSAGIISTDKKEEILDNLDAVYQLARNISRENSPVETGEKYADELLSLISSYKNNQTNVVLMGFSEMEWNRFQDEKQIQFYKVIQELLTNMKKHSRASLVVLSFKVEKNNFEFFYTDNGVGLSDNQLNTKNGIRITENRIEKLKGTVSFVCEPHKGLKVNIRIPL